MYMDLHLGIVDISIFSMKAGFRMVFRTLRTPAKRVSILRNGRVTGGPGLILTRVQSPRQPRLIVLEIKMLVATDSGYK